MTSKYNTTGGVPTRADAYTKLIWHLTEAQDQAYLLSHLHRTEASKMDELVSKGWMGIGELIGRMKIQITKLAANKFQ